MKRLVVMRLQTRDLKNEPPPPAPPPSRSISAQHEFNEQDAVAPVGHSDYPPSACLLGTETHGQVPCHRKIQIVRL